MPDENNIFFDKFTEECEFCHGTGLIDKYELCYACSGLGVLLNKLGCDYLDFMMFFASLHGSDFAPIIEYHLKQKKFLDVVMSNSSKKVEKKVNFEKQYNSLRGRSDFSVEKRKEFMKHVLNRQYKLNFITHDEWKECIRKYYYEEDLM